MAASVRIRLCSVLTVEHRRPNADRPRPGQSQGPDAAAHCWPRSAAAWSPSTGSSIPLGLGAARRPGRQRRHPGQPEPTVLGEGVLAATGRAYGSAPRGVHRRPRRGRPVSGRGSQQAVGGEPHWQRAAHGGPCTSSDRHPRYRTWLDADWVLRIRRAGRRTATEYSPLLAEGVTTTEPAEAAGGAS